MSIYQDYDGLRDELSMSVVNDNVHNKAFLLPTFCYAETSGSEAYHIALEFRGVKLSLLSWIDLEL